MIINKLILIFSVFSFAFGAYAQPGVLDTTFNSYGNTFGNKNGIGADNYILATVIQNDGKIIVGGYFKNYDSVPRIGVARLNVDGSLDLSFNSQIDDINGNATIHTVCLQSDGKILIGGYFSAYNGISRNNIARLHSDGSLDLSFNPGIGTNSFVRTISIQSDEKIIIGGDFDSFNGVLKKGITRLNLDGTIDSSFTLGNLAGFNSCVYSTAIQSDGKILVGSCSFGIVNGFETNGILRLNIDGTLDTSFNTGLGISGLDNRINCISIQNDGKIVIGGIFSSYNGVVRNGITRINLDGTLDLTFNTAYNNGNGVENGTGVASVNCISIQSDGKIIFVGEFYKYKGVISNGFRKINIDGSIAPNFTTDIVGGGSGNIFSSVLMQVDGKIILSGIFSFYTGPSQDKLCRLDNDGVVDLTFSCIEINGLGGQALITVIQNDGKIIIGKCQNYNGTYTPYIARLNIDGTLDHSFNPENGPNQDINSILLQSDGKIIIAGSFTTYNGIPRKRIARLNIDGSLDSSFVPGTDIVNEIFTSAIQSNGKIVIGFSSYIMRLNIDGTTDSTFSASFTSGTVKSIAIQNNDKIIVAGYFTNYNGISRNCISRLNSNGTNDLSFLVGNGFNNYVNSMIVQNDNKIIVVGFFSVYNYVNFNNIVRLNSDGTLDTSFVHSGTGANAQIYTVNLQTDGKILVGGIFTSWNGYLTKHLARLNNNGTFDLTFDTGEGTDYEVKSISIQTDGKIIIGGYFYKYNNVEKRGIVRIYGGDLLINTIQPNGNSIYCTGNNILTSFNVFQSFSNGNIFTAQLSDNVGNFSSPTNLGSISSTTDGTINGVLPFGLSAGTGYKLRVVSSNPISIGSSYVINIKTSSFVDFIQQQSTVCDYSIPITLSIGSPLGGIYNGAGVTGNNFDPNISGIGTFPITYSYTNANNCTNSATSQITVNSCAGIEELINSKTSFKVFPNPFNEMAIVQFNSIQIKTEVKVVNIMGEEVQKIVVNNVDKAIIKKENLQRGIYILYIFSDGNIVETEKLIVTE